MQIFHSILILLADFHCPLFFPRVRVRAAPKTKVKVVRKNRSSE